MYLKTLLKRAWANTTQFAKEHILSEVLFVLVIAAVGYLRGDVLSQILSPLVYGLVAAALIAICALSYNLLLAPARIYYDQQTEINALKKQSEPTLQIEFREDDDIFYHESQWFYELEDLFDNRSGYNAIKYWRLCRIGVKNCSRTTSIENVEVKLTSIDPLPKELRGKLPLSLHFMNDNIQPYKQSKDINPDSTEFIDVVVWSLDRQINKPTYSIYHSVNNIDANFPVGDYKVTIEVFGKNATGQPKTFYIGRRNRDGKANKLWMSEKPL